MTIEEIFTKLINHMNKGVIFHKTIAQAYNFLELQGLTKCHISHYIEELKGCQQLEYYYTTHYFKLLKIEDIQIPKLIPETWYKYTTQDVDNSTKKQAIKELMLAWINWEKETKKLYQEMRQELIQINEIDAALQLDLHIRDVSKELAHAEKKLIKLETLGYDMYSIIEWQEKMEKKYKKKLGW